MNIIQSLKNANTNKMTLPFTTLTTLPFPSPDTGYVIDLRSTSGRLVFTSLYAMTILLYAHYSSFLFSSLTVHKATPPFTNLAEMHKAGTHTLGLESGGALEDYLKVCMCVYDIWADMQIQRHVPAHTCTHMHILSSKCVHMCVYVCICM